MLADPEMVCKISQGVTTVVTGNCGISLAPLKPGAPRPMPLGLIAAEDDPAVAFERFADYLAAPGILRRFARQLRKLFHDAL